MSKCKVNTVENVSGTKSFTVDEVRAMLDEVIGISDFDNSLTEQGYQKLPNGCIMQWGKGAGSQTVTFPIPFPSYCASVNATEGASGSNESLVVNTITPSSFNITMSLESRTFTWFAIGY